MRGLIDLALAAGAEIMAVYAQDFSARAKSDLTPVTEADEVAERLILDGLAGLDPATPVISEEAAAAGRIPVVAGRFYLVDPLDGTKEFISRNGEFTVNIALVEEGVPVAGVVFAPAQQRIFWGEKGLGAARAPGSALSAVLSNSPNTPWTSSSMTVARPSPMWPMSPRKPTAAAPLKQPCSAMAASIASTTTSAAALRAMSPR